MNSNLKTRKIDFDTSFELFNSLSNELRNEILTYLSNKQSSLSNISKIINQSNQSTLGHLKKLAESGLIVKTMDGDYSISEYGKSVLIKTQSLEFITKHKKFFAEHTFGETPSFLLNCIGMLSKGEFVDGAVANFERWKKMIENSNEFFYGIFTQTPHRTDVSIATKSETGLKIKLIFGKNGEMSDYFVLSEKLNFEKQISQNIERRISDVTHVNLMITESQACVMFPDRKNQTDLGKTFTSSDLNFHQWCMEFFNYKWNESESFSRFRDFS